MKIVIQSNMLYFKATALEISKITGGKLDVLINNGAFLDSSDTPLGFDDYSEKEAEEIETKFLKSFRVNVVGVVHTINVFLPLIKAGKTKKIITISSGAGDLDGVPLMGAFATPYSVSKAAVNLAIGKYAVKYKEEGIIFLSISPGMVDTTATALEPPSEELLKEFGTVVGNIQKIYPDFKGPISTEESARMVLDVVNKATIKDTGAFVSHKGNKEWV